MLRTYTLYLRDGGEPARFVPFMGRTDVEALRRARALLEAHPECHTIEVFFGDELLFTLEQPRP